MKRLRKYDSRSLRHLKKHPFKRKRKIRNKYMGIEILCSAKQINHRGKVDYNYDNTTYRWLLRHRGKRGKITMRDISRREKIIALVSLRYCLWPRLTNNKNQICLASNITCEQHVINVCHNHFHGCNVLAIDKSIPLYLLERSYVLEVTI